MSNGNVKAEPKTRKEYLGCIEDLQLRSMDPNLSLPQRVALLNRSQELRAQLVEIEAARFNKASANYIEAIKTLNQTITDLRAAAKRIDKAIALLDTAGKVFAAADKLLTEAVKHFPIGPF